MSHNSVEQRVKQVIASQFGKDVSSVGTEQYLEEFDIDSLDIVEIVMSLETEFNISIEDEEYQPANSVNKIIDLVNRKLQSA